jgi:hypothetical protein
MSALNRILSEKSDRELMFYINNLDKHTEEAVRVALEILKSRHVILPEDITETINNHFEQQKEKPRVNLWNKNITTDSEALEFYSQKSIYIFSILFSVLFGSVMLAYNLRKVKKPFIWAILFGLTYSSLSVYFIEKYNGSLPMTFIANSLGAVVLYQLCWNRWIGKQTKYRAKSIWIPLIIALIIFIPLTILTILES